MTWILGNCCLDRPLECSTLSPNTNDNFHIENAFIPQTLVLPLLCSSTQNNFKENQHHVASNHGYFEYPDRIHGIDQLNLQGRMGRTAVLGNVVNAVLGQETGLV